MIKVMVKYCLFLGLLLFSIRGISQKKAPVKKVQKSTIQKPVKQEPVLAKNEPKIDKSGKVPGSMTNGQDSLVTKANESYKESAYSSELSEAIEKYRKSKVLTMNEENVKGSYKISVAFYKTSHIIFPTTVKYFDVGSDRVLAEVADNMNNVLKLKASAVDGFETNVTVITADGKFYSFIVSYSEEPLKLNIVMSETDGKKPEKMDKIEASKEKIIFTDTYYTEKDLSDFAKKAIKTSNIKHIVDKLGKVTFKVSALQSKESNVFINVKIINNSPLDFDIETLKFFVRDVERRKKELTQEIEVKPAFAYIQDKHGKIEAKLCGSGTEYNFCFMLPKFVITEDKNLDIDIREKNGGRNTTLTIDYDTFYYEMTKL